MSLTESTMLPLGSLAPEFSLKSTEENLVTLGSFESPKALVVMFICNHCPYVIHIAEALQAVAQRYQAKGIDFVAINSNDTDTYPADNFEAMKVEKLRRGYTFPYLIDADQSVAKAYMAACTPDFFVFNGERALVYRGQFDDSRPHRISSGNYDASQGVASGKALSDVLDSVIADEPISEHQRASMGCNIKWRNGNEPAYS